MLETGTEYIARGGYKLKAGTWYETKTMKNQTKNEDCLHSNKTTARRP